MTEQATTLPLLVRIQSVDIPSLDFQGAGGGSGVSKSSRHITYVEGTNLFLFVGCTSGTVYVFSRESLKLMFMIPFKGGKVCHILASLDESDVAVASIRGKVSIYRISPSIHYTLSHDTEHTKLSNNSSGGDAFRHLYDVPHHIKTEITEMQWSPNGKFLFIGDSQGVISEVDVASFDEFPRPPPSRTILKLQSRILQIDCTFPYMAICTLDAVYLCDLEKEDFTRIKNTRTKNDIKSTGLALSVLPERNGDAQVMPLVGKMALFVGEVGSGCMYHCNLDGTVSHYKKINLSPGVSSSINLFDPKATKHRMSTHESELNYSLGKMLSTDDGLLVSVSSNRIFVYDPFTMDIILWNDDFNRINSFKVIANYGFVWYGNKLDVFAFTQFRSYGEQLFKAGLHPVVESFVSYAVRSAGWVEKQVNGESGQSEPEVVKEFESATEISEDHNEHAVANFRKMISPVDEEDSFCAFVSQLLPFPLFEPKPEVIEIESEMQRFERVVEKLCSDLAELTQDSDMNSIPLVEWFERFVEYSKGFYTELGASLPQLQCKHSELTLSKALYSVHTFQRQPQLVNLHEDVTHLPLSLVQRVEDCTKSVLKYLAGYISIINSSSESTDLSGAPDTHGVCTKCSQNPVIHQYFKEIGVSSKTIWYDGLLADILLLLVPLVPEEQLAKVVETTFNLKEDFPSLFFSWMVLSSVVSNCLPLPYGPILRNLQNERFFNKLAEEVFLTIFKDAMGFLSQQDYKAQQKSSMSVKYLHHFASYIILYSKSPNLKPRGVSLLLQCFPIKRTSKIEIIEKVTQLCCLNPFVYKMLHKACIEDGNSLKLCECGIPASYGSLEKVTPPFQKAVEEAILSILVEDYLSLETLGNNDDESKDTEQSKLKLIRNFGMRRCLVEASLGADTCDEILPDYLKIHLLLRTGVCGALKHLKFDLENLKVLREFTRDPEKILESCPFCHHQLTVQTKRNGISRDCLGVWIVENCHSLDKFMSIIKKMSMNSPNEFSVRFYRFLIQRDDLRKYKKEDAGFGDLVCLSSLNCSLLH